MFNLTDFPTPFNPSDLEPHISAKTIEVHHGKHLATYISNLNGLIPGTKYEGMQLFDIIEQSAEKPEDKKIFNNAAQIFNHDFFFRGLSAKPNEFPAFLGDREAFNKKFKDAALGVFGSGWAWLVFGLNGPEIITTANADTPIAHGIRPLLTIDVWEHAYYLDYQNRRAEFIDKFLAHLVNWDFVAQNAA